MSENLLNSGLKKLGIPENQTNLIQEKVEKYIKEIILFNSAYNLTNTSDHDELVVRHILDSLSTYKIIDDEIKAFSEKNGTTPLFADIGSGGGLPGIPLSICFPEIKFSLVERMEKRCAFLENCTAILGLKNAEVVNLEAEKVPENSFDFIVFRAFRPLDKKMTKTLLKMVKSGGKLLAYKAKMESIKEEMDAIKDLAGNYEIKPLSVPFLEENERNLVIVTKN